MRKQKNGDHNTEAEKVAVNEWSVNHQQRLREKSRRLRVNAGLIMRFGNRETAAIAGHHWSGLSLETDRP